MKWYLSRKDRIALKRYITVLGLLLLLFLLGGSIWSILRHSGNRPGANGENRPDDYVPQIEKISNAWIIEIGEDNVLLYRDGEEVSYDLGMVNDRLDPNPESNCDSLYQPDWGFREQVANITLTDGRVTNIEPLMDKIHGKILSADENGIDIEGLGYMPLAEDYRGYRIFNTLEMCTYRDLVFGYDFADLVINQGEVCGILLAREDAMENIRVLIKTGDFEEVLHDEIIISGDTEFEIVTEDASNHQIFPAGEKVTITAESDYFTDKRIIIRPLALTGKLFLNNVSRSQGTPGYRGQMELVRKGDKFAVVNEVTLEEYLYSVVPSEMPASYSMEALKAQAICARTYAYGHMQHAAYPAYGAHVDDSTTYQVYNNILEQESTTKAVKSTHGQLLYTKEDEVAETYYYSTSCGVGSDATVWKTEAAKELDYLRATALNPEVNATTTSDTVTDHPTDLATFLQDEENFYDFITTTNPADFEAEESWYRWIYTVKKIDIDHMNEILQKRYKAKPELVLTKAKKGFISEEPKTFTKLKEISVLQRGPGGVCDELLIETDNGTYKIISEHNIRYVLCDGATKVTLANGKQTAMPNLLPSGFFVIETTQKDGNVVGYTLHGGGFGHGVGMSQNGAKNMANNGYTCEDILLCFYKDCVIKTME